jgi:uncharacterized Zn-binding protein involved in type VI secretion
VVIGQSTVRSNGKLWSVEGDPNTHGGGALIASSNVYIEGKRVVVHRPDNANPDDADHSNPATAQGSADVNCA